MVSKHDKPFLLSFYFPLQGMRKEKLQCSKFLFVEKISKRLLVHYEARTETTQGKALINKGR